MLLPYDLTMIAAYMGRRRIIGFEGEMPWPRIDTETQLFRILTQNAIVVMGRVTWDAILRRNGHGLRGRVNIVLSHEDREDTGGYIPAFSIEDAFSVIARCREGNNQKVFVIGGRQVYQGFLPYATRLLFSRIVHRRGFLPQADTHFPDYSKKEFPLHRRVSSGWDGRYRVVIEERVRQAA